VDETDARRFGEALRWSLASGIISICSEEVAVLAIAVSSAGKKRKTTPSFCFLPATKRYVVWAAWFVGWASTWAAAVHQVSLPLSSLFLFIFSVLYFVD
jgi:hypothetical protein